jgi:hypothetical protein
MIFHVSGVDAFGNILARKDSIPHELGHGGAACTRSPPALILITGSGAACQCLAHGYVMPSKLYEPGSMGLLFEPHGRLTSG